MENLTLPFRVDGKNRLKIVTNPFKTAHCLSEDNWLKRIKIIIRRVNNLKL